MILDMPKICVSYGGDNVLVMFDHVSVSIDKTHGNVINNHKCVMT